MTARSNLLAAGLASVALTGALASGATATVNPPASSDSAASAQIATTAPKGFQKPATTPARPLSRDKHSDAYVTSSVRGVKITGPGWYPAYASYKDLYGNEWATRTWLKVAYFGPSWMRVSEITVEGLIKGSGYLTPTVTNLHPGIRTNDRYNRQWRGGDWHYYHADSPKGVWKMVFVDNYKLGPDAWYHGGCASGAPSVSIDAHVSYGYTPSDIYSNGGTEIDFAGASCFK